MWGAAMDLGGWLRNLGLDEYAAAFRENGIDEHVLCHVTAEDLRRIGVSAVGDRRRLLVAIGELAGASLSMELSPTPSFGLRPKTPEVSAERRPITVMFCDLVGSTGLAASLDVEDWRVLLSAYLDAASAAVSQMGGRVAKTLGDGLIALFGHPIAQENDSERAVRAALAIQRALAELNRKNDGSGQPKLDARIGIESGAVVVDEAGEIFGDAPNVAARVQALAEPGTVMVTARVQHQVSGLFVAEDRGAHLLKDAREPTTLFRIVRGSGGRRGGARALTPLVGREEELDLLRRRWERAARGEGQIALVVGEPGIGKSRLIKEFRLRLRETPHTFVEWSSSQLLQNTPLHPLAEWGRQRFGADLPGEERLADLENTLRLIGLDASEYAPLVAPLVDVPLPEERAAKLAPEELRRRQMAALTSWVLAGARSQPAAVVFEDLHWADPTTLDLMQALAERAAQAPLLIIATMRPEFRPSWSARSQHSVIALSPLDRADVALMVGELAQGHALTQEVVEAVSERTGGVPLFIEEVTRLLLERGEVGGLQAIPPTLQQSLAARLDRLGEAREVAQIGAVLGREFSYALLAAVGGVVGQELQTAADVRGLKFGLDRLVDADLLFVEGAGAQATYRFKHALIQDVAYDSLLRSRRHALHRRAAEILRDDPGRAAAEPEVIAHHLTQGGLDDLAIEWWGKAGDLALYRSAFKEAIAHLGKAIEMTEALAGAGEVDQTGGKLKLHVAYAHAMIAAHGHGAPETVAAFVRAHELAADSTDMQARFSSNYGLWAGSYLHGDLPGMFEPAQAFLRDVETRPGSPEAGVAHRAYGVTQWFTGNFVEARTHLEHAVAVFNPERDRDLAFRFGQDVGVSAMVYLAIVLWPLGEVDRAREIADATAARIANLNHLATSTYGLMHCAMFEIIARNAGRAAPLAKALSSVAHEHGIALWIGFGAFLEAWVELESRPASVALLNMRRAAALLDADGVGAFKPLVKASLAEAEARNGELKAALATLEEALDGFDRTGQRWFNAEIHRMRGGILLELNPEDPALAVDALLTAIGVAQAQKTRSFELRAALALARLYRSTGRHADAQAAIGPALEGFAPTPELPEIAAALAFVGDIEAGAQL